MNAYADLMDNKMFQDALILHLMYSVGINPDTLVLITYDSLNDSGKLNYFDTLKLAYVEITLNENLIRDFLHFKEIMREIKSEAKHDFRCFKDKVVVIGEFIFEYTSSAIYSRFARRFGGKLPNFKYTPNQIIQLSETIQALKNENNKFESLNLIEDSINA